MDVILTNKVRLVGNTRVKGILSCSDHDMFKIPRAARRVHSKLDIWPWTLREEFGLFNYLCCGIKGLSPGGKRDKKRLFNIQGSPSTKSRFVHLNKKAKVSGGLYG